MAHEHGAYKVMVVFKRQSDDATAAMRIQSVVGTRFQYHGLPTSGGADSPVIHVEIVFTVSCGGSTETCMWRPFSVFIRNPSAGQAGPVSSCSPGTVHTLSIGAVDAQAYCIRAVLDRAFTDYGCMQIELTHTGYERAFNLAMAFVEWSNSTSNTQYNARFRGTSGFRAVGPKSMRLYHQRVEDALDPADQPADDSEDTVLGMVASCLSQPCTPPRSGYNKTGMFYNMMPCCFPKFGIHTSEVLEPDTGFDKLRPRPVFCSELVLAILIAAGIPTPKGLEPYDSTPFDIHRMLVRLAAVPEQSVDTTGWMVSQRDPPTTVVPNPQ